MRLSETDEIASELYLVPPAQFVAARDEMVREAREAGNRELARELQGLRRPTLSAWLVNLLARHERVSMERLSVVGRELRDAQAELDRARLRQLAAERQQLVTGLLDRARRRAAETGLQPSEGVLGEVEATLNAALVDLAGSFTVLAGRLSRPMSHSGFGPTPHVSLTPPVTDTGPEPTEAGPEPGLESAPEPGHESGPEPGPGWHLRLVEDAPDLVVPHEPEPEPDLGRAEADLAAAEASHWQREHDLADAEAAADSARERLDWLENQRMEARREKVTAEQRLTQAQEAQRAAVRAVAEARRALEDLKNRTRPRG